MHAALLRAVRIVLWPTEEWEVIEKEVAKPLVLLSGFVLPLACIPAVCWALGLALFGGKGVVAGDSAEIDLGRIAHGGFEALVGSLASVLLLALSLFVLAPLFARRRSWQRVLQVAAYSSAPVLLAGFLLVMPDLVFVPLFAAVHAFYLLYVGVQRILGTKMDEAAEYVALVVVLLVVASTLLGALGSWSGIL